MRATAHLPHLLVLLGLVGCAPPRAVPPAAETAPLTDGGTILSMRPVTASIPVETVLLSEVGGDTPDGLVEFIVRADDGAVLSIVQPNESGLHTGERVLILRAVRTRLARPG